MLQISMFPKETFFRLIFRVSACFYCLILVPPTMYFKCMAFIFVQHMLLLHSKHMPDTVLDAKIILVGKTGTVPSVTEICPTEEKHESSNHINCGKTNKQKL